MSSSCGNIEIDKVSVTLTFVIPYVKDALIAILIASQSSQYAVFNGVDLLNSYSP
jgi:hypothetical protein